MLYDLGYFGNNPNPTSRHGMVQNMIAGMDDMYHDNQSRYLEYCRNILSGVETRTYVAYIEEKAAAGAITQAQANQLLTRRKNAMEASRNGAGWSPPGYLVGWPSLAWRP